MNNLFAALLIRVIKHNLAQSRPVNAAILRAYIAIGGRWKTKRICRQPFMWCASHAQPCRNHAPESQLTTIVAMVDLPAIEPVRPMIFINSALLPQDPVTQKPSSGNSGSQEYQKSHQRWK